MYFEVYTWRLYLTKDYGLFFYTFIFMFHRYRQNGKNPKNEKFDEKLFIECYTICCCWMVFQVNDMLHGKSGGFLYVTIHHIHKKWYNRTVEKYISLQH